MIWSTRGTHTIIQQHTHTFSSSLSDTEEKKSFLFPKESSNQPFKKVRTIKHILLCLCVCVCVQNIQHYSLKLDNKLYIKADFLLVSSSLPSCSDWWKDGGRVFLSALIGGNKWHHFDCSDSWKDKRRWSLL